MPNSAYLTIGLAILIAGGSTVFYASRDKLWGTEQSSGLLRANHAETIALGSKIYTANCAACHGSNLEGQPNWRSPGEDGLLPAPPHDSTGHTWHHTDKVLFGITKYGLARFSGLEGYESAMPVYENVLPDKEIIAVLSYIKSRWPVELRNRHDDLNNRN